MMHSDGSETGTWPCPCGYDLTPGGRPCREEREAGLPDDERHRTHPPTPGWMVDQALSWPCGCPTELNPINLSHETTHRPGCPDTWTDR